MSKLIYYFEIQDAPYVYVTLFVFETIVSVDR